MYKKFQRLICESDPRLYGGSTDVIDGEVEWNWSQDARFLDQIR